ncbi:hypothetical protein J3R82DRAFT_11865 [Butyriboletus roseoflavus]|nr:hypothetical protein J3R82DRAFT_11865 [Butyriboletus roseoflavus]
MSILNSPTSQHSRSSSGFSLYTQPPPPSGLNYRTPSIISTCPSQVRPVRQLFVPALPDELALVRYGEGLTVFRSFDDDWCLVTRDKTRSSWVSPPPIWKTNNGDNVDIGLVPAWVFIKPLKGITVTRPFRNESINALHLGQNWAPAPTRDAVISWSYIAL